MNPPFSQTAGRLRSRHVVEEGTDYMFQALRRLRPGGCLVTVIGHNVQRGRSAFAPFFAHIDDTDHAGCVRADVKVDDRIYRTCGTTYDTRVLVIDKVPAGMPATEWGVEAVLTGRVESAEALLHLLAPVRELRLPIQDDGRAGEGYVRQPEHSIKRVLYCPTQLRPKGS